MPRSIHPADIIRSDRARSRAFCMEAPGLRMIAENHRAERDSWKPGLGLPNGG